jgi:hypothetical protein
VGDLVRVSEAIDDRPGHRGDGAGTGRMDTATAL